MKVLITGITGFVGSHLAEYCLGKGAEVFGTIRWRSRTENIDHIRSKIKLIDCDLRDASSVIKALEQSKPDYIFHLAAQSYIPSSWHAPAETLVTNIIGQVNLFEAIRELKLNPRVQLAGSSEEYGLVYENEIPIRETNPLRPLSPYGVSKVAQDLLGYQYHRSYGMHIVRTRAFNHSVSKWTPVMIRDDSSGLIDIKYINEMRNKYKIGGYKSGKFIGDVKVWNLRRYNLSVWSNNHWVKLKEISCHPIRDNKLIRILTKKGLLEVTDNHSIIGKDLKPEEVVNLKIGDKVAIVNYPSSNIMHVNEEVAWFFGFFVAEGCITVGKVRVDNTNKTLLDKTKRILLKHFGKDSFYQENKSSLRLSVRNPGKFAKWLYPQVYASDGNKKVPQCILNAQKEAKLAFLEGYNEGDGLKKGHGEYKFKNFKTKSRILAAGLCYLIKETTGQEININFEDKRKGYISINLNSDIKAHKNWGKHLQKPDGIIKSLNPIDYSEEVWDFSTEDGMFQAGVGNLLAHNTGPRRGEVFVASNFAKQIAEIEKGLKEPVIEVGNLEAKRDFSDVRDVVRAYWLALEKCEPGEVYNIASGKAVKIADMLNMLLKLSDVDVEIRQDPARMRPSDVPILAGDATKFKKATGWEPEIPFEKTLEDLLNYWRKRV